MKFCDEWFKVGGEEGERETICFGKKKYFEIIDVQKASNDFKQFAKSARHEIYLSKNK